jgi:hypothetical protein
VRRLCFRPGRKLIVSRPRSTCDETGEGGALGNLSREEAGAAAAGKKELSLLLVLLLRTGSSGAIACCNSSEGALADAGSITAELEEELDSDDSVGPHQRVMLSCASAPALLVAGVSSSSSSSSLHAAAYSLPSSMRSHDHKDELEWDPKRRKRFVRPLLSSPFKTSSVFHHMTHVQNAVQLIGYTNDGNKG